MESNKVVDSAAYIASNQTRKDDVKGSFAHLRATAATGPDRRSLVNLYKSSGGLGQVTPQYPEEQSRSTGESDEIFGSIDLGLVSQEWVEVLTELSMNGGQLPVLSLVSPASHIDLLPTHSFTACSFFSGLTIIHLPNHHFLVCAIFSCLLILFLPAHSPT
jgi:hypothetical protein